MARERYVPTPAEVDEGFDPGIKRERRGPLKKLREAIAPKRVAKHEVRLQDGVGESRVVTPAPRIEPMRSVQTPAPEPVQPVVARKPPAPRQRVQPQRAKAQPPAAPAAPRRARRTRVAPDVMPAGPSTTTGDPDSRVGAWPRGLSPEELHRRIGQTQQYGDDT
jgi:hypothetical protein